MYVDLTKTSSKLTLELSSSLSENDLIKLGVGDAYKNFIFDSSNRTNIEENIYVDLATLASTKANGSVYLDNQMYNGNAFILNNYGVDSENNYGVVFSKYGSFCAIRFDSNLATSFTINANGTNYGFYICSPENIDETNENHQINLGTSLVNTASNVASVINYYLLGLGIKAIATSNYVMLIKENDDSTLQGNANASLHFSLGVNGYIANNASLSFNGSSFQFVNEETIDIEGTIGGTFYAIKANDINVSAQNLVNAINRSSKLYKTGFAYRIDSEIYIYNALSGENGNIVATNNGISSDSTTFSGGATSNVVVTFEDSYVSVIDCNTAFIDDEYNKDNTLASFSCALKSSNDFNSYIKENSESISYCYIESLLVGSIYNLDTDYDYNDSTNNKIYFYGNNSVSSISGGSESETNIDTSLVNLSEAIVAQYTDCSYEISDGVSTIVMENYSIYVDSSATSSTIAYTAWSDGTSDEPMSWEEFVNYYTSSSISYANIILTKGTFDSSKQTLALSNVSFESTSGISITTLDSITFEKEMITFSSCIKPNVSISGKYKSDASVSGAFNLLKMTNCKQATIKINNAEYTSNNHNSHFVYMIGCVLNSTISVSNSTHTISSADYNVSQSVYYVSGSVGITSKYNVFEKYYDVSDTSVSYGYTIASNSYFINASEIKDVYYNMQICSGYLFSDYAGCINSTKKVVCNCDNENDYDLNLTSDSDALMFANDDNVSSDIDGNVRGFKTTQYGTIVGTLAFVNGQTSISLSANDYFQFGDYKRTLVTEQTSVTLEQLAKLIVNAFTYDTPINISYNGNVITIKGEIISYYTTLSSNITFAVTLEGIGNNSTSVVNVIDAGSRQKNTKRDIEISVDLSESVATEKDSIDYVTNYIKTLSPLYGSLTITLNNENDTNKVIDLSETISSSNLNFVLFGSISFKGNMLSINKVPKLLGRFELDVSGGHEISFENMMLCCDGSMPINGSTNKNQIIKVIDSVIKATTTNVIFANYSMLHIVESTLVKTLDTTFAVRSNGVTHSCGSVYSVGDNVIQTTSQNTIKLDYNYYVSDDAVIDCVSGTLHDVGNVSGEQVLADPYNATIEINNFKLISDSQAEMFISTSSLLDSVYYSKYDIGGRLRADDETKVSLDCGAYETNTILPTTKTIYVNLGLTIPSGGGKTNPTSLMDAYETILAMSSIDCPIELVLYGYGRNLPTLDLGDMSFTDSGYIRFIANPDSVLECSQMIISNDSNAKIEIKYLAMKEYEDLESNSFIYVPNGSVSMVSCLVISNETVVHNIIKCSKFVGYGNTLISHANDLLVKSSDGLLIGNAFVKYTSGNAFDITNMDSNSVENSGQGISDISSIGTNYATLIATDNSNEETIDVKDFAVTNIETTEVIIANIDESVLEDAIAFGFENDILGGIKSIKSGSVVTPGCIDNNAEELSGYYDDIPNGQYAKITEEGSSLITRMILGSIKLKIDGYSVCQGGYNYGNPVNAIKINDDVARKSYTITINSNSFSEGYGIAIEGTNIVYSTTQTGNNIFTNGSTIKATTSNIVEAINKSNKYMYATFSNNVITLSSIMPSSIGNNYVVSKLGEAPLTIVENDDVADTNYELGKVLPKDGYRSFEYVEYLPLAISLFLRIERYEFSGSIGELVVYAKVTDSDVVSEIGKVIPFAVVHHGLVTKDKRTILASRIIIQI